MRNPRYHHYFPILIFGSLIAGIWAWLPYGRLEFSDRKTQLLSRNHVVEISKPEPPLQETVHISSRQ